MSMNLDNKFKMNIVYIFNVLNNLRNRGCNILDFIDVNMIDDTLQENDIINTLYMKVNNNLYFINYNKNNYNLIIRKNNKFILNSNINKPISYIKPLNTFLEKNKDFYDAIEKYKEELSNKINNIDSENNVKDKLEKLINYVKDDSNINVKRSFILNKVENRNIDRLDIYILNIMGNVFKLQRTTIEDFITDLYIIALKDKDTIAFNEEDVRINEDENMKEYVNDMYNITFGYKEGYDDNTKFEDLLFEEENEKENISLQEFVDKVFNDSDIIEEKEDLNIIDILENGLIKYNKEEKEFIYSKRELDKYLVHHLRKVNILSTNPIFENINLIYNIILDKIFTDELEMNLDNIYSNVLIDILKESIYFIIDDINRSYIDSELEVRIRHHIDNFIKDLDSLKNELHIVIKVGIFINFLITNKAMEICKDDKEKLKHHLLDLILNVYVPIGKIIEIQRI